MNAAEQVFLPDEINVGTFVPVAYFDRHMDCIRVITHDRSVTEHRLNESVTLLECNHRSGFDPQYVGFTIKGVNQLFHSMGLNLETCYRLADLIDMLVRYRPGSMLSETLKFLVAQYGALGELQVELKAAA